ncbi:ATP-binding protein [Spirochaeta cellobiosiphila]|uniref:ATP-binding protein n=1 Tax=Spirochaeta cellobiosiphila TaxID=504483 RepID=UPI00042A8C48|nr:ATP-binding protein [Spirochaeta cellobiosiphila]
MSNTRGYIELKFGPRWKYIAPARSFIQNFLAIAIDNTAKADAIAMAASELLENAVKYAHGEETGIIVQVFPDEQRITASVTNKGDKSSIKELKAIYSRINEGDPLEAYVSQMKIAATREDGKSQLGLARIRYEVGAKLSMETNEDDMITITIEADWSNTGDSSNE